MLRAPTGPVAYGLLLLARGAAGQAPLRQLARECPEGATCGDVSYIEAAYPCQDGSLQPGQANIIEFRCSDGGCIRARGLCNDVLNCKDSSDEQHCENFRTAADASALAAPYDCSAEVEDWQSAWSGEKQRWCCAKATRGCPEKTAAFPQVAPTAGSEATGSQVKSSAPFNCKDWTYQWTASQKAYCCNVEETGCTMTDLPDSAAPYNCNCKHELDGSHVAPSWAKEHREWCCAARGVGCPADVKQQEAKAKAPATLEKAKPRYDCSKPPEVSLSQQVLAFAGDSMVIEDDISIGGTASATEAPTTAPWSAAQQRWCCEAEQVGCAEADAKAAASTTAAAASTSRGAAAAAAVSGPRVTPPQELADSASSEESMVKATMKCTKSGYSYEPDLAGTVADIEPNVAACQAKCAHTTRCAIFTYRQSGGACRLHSEDALGNVDSADVLSAPPTCDDRGSEELEVLSDMMRERACFQIGQAYIPLDRPGSIPQVEATPSVCQQSCAAAEWCVGFTYDVRESLCHLADSGAAESSDPQTTAGPRTCQETVTFSLSVGGVKIEVLQNNATLRTALEDAVKGAVNQALGGKKAPGSSGSSASVVSASHIQVVLLSGARGGLTIGVMLAPSSLLPAAMLQRTLWERLHILEVEVATFVTKADSEGRHIDGFIHVHLLTPPARLGGGASRAGSGDGDEFARKFLKVPATSRLPQARPAARGPLLLLTVAGLGMLFLGAAVLSLSRHSRSLRSRMGTRWASISAVYVGLADGREDRQSSQLLDCDDGL